VSKEKATNFDYEAELVIVIGRTPAMSARLTRRNTSFGFCTGNDFTRATCRRARAVDSR